MKIISQSGRPIMRDDKTIVIFADGHVGKEVVAFVLEKHPSDLRCVVTVEDNEIAALARENDCPVIAAAQLTPDNTKELLGNARYIFLAWWPKLIPKHVINAASVGVVNFHPSLLPYNRGKHYNFWTLVEDTPFGVSLHFVDEGIDSGDILFQAPISKTWEDTGGTLFYKAREAILSLFKLKYLDIVEGRYIPTQQDLGRSRLHYAKELDKASEIQLDKTYTGRELLNLLRARTFEGMPACYFWDHNKKYEVRISITEAPHGQD
jgi:methionyl-tRNA formyltransferase